MSARYWVSWWTGNYADEGCTKPPFDSMVSGERQRRDQGNDQSHCMLFDCDPANEVAMTDLVEKHFPDAEFRFIERKPDDYEPGDRFPGMRAFEVKS